MFMSSLFKFKIKSPIDILFISKHLLDTKQFEYKPIQTNTNMTVLPGLEEIVELPYEMIYVSEYSAKK